MSQPTLRGQRIVVIGGSSGIGLAVAEGALAEGARVVVASSRPETVETAVKHLGEGAAGAVVDCRDEASIATFFETTGAFDHLAYTAGDWGRAMGGQSVAKMDVASAKDGMAVRFWGALMAIKHAQGRISPTGSITLTDGVLAHRPMRGVPLSTAFGGAVEHLARGLAVDLAPLRVNAVCPGLVMSGATKGMPEAMVKGFTARCLIPRAGEPAEVAQAYLYLMRGAYTTGQVLIVDGGLMLT
ncbi:MAG TPA: SDR family oxidoreductase [Caulobacteraceae bacterium]|jgi:NAD(P)-dependent dehydrogenase (short-subunit alcohol dehydrogenase family)|nr:SDR family oxidoreductase [Caulobacteraceae bacterium]